MSLRMVMLKFVIIYKVYYHEKELYQNSCQIPEHRGFHWKLNFVTIKNRRKILVFQY